VRHLAEIPRELPVALTLLLPYACGSDDPSGDDAAPGDDTSSGGSESGVVDGFLAATAVPSADDFFTLVGVVPSLDEPEARLWLRLTTTAEVQNLTDARVFDFFGVQRPGRAFYLEVTEEI